MDIRMDKTSVYICIDMCTDICMGMCTGICIDMCIAIRIDMCVVCWSFGLLLGGKSLATPRIDPSCWW